MAFQEQATRPHAMCIPLPAQGHVNPMLKLAKLLHQRGFHISFVHNEFNQRRLLKSRGPAALDGLPDFRYYAIPDGVPPTDPDATQAPGLLFTYTPVHCLEPIAKLVSKFNDEANLESDVPPVTCIIADGLMSFALNAAQHLDIPKVLFWTTSACGLLGYSQYGQLVERGYTPLKGRFIEDDLLVCCNDEGVKYVEAIVDLCLEDILEGRVGLELLDRLVPNDDEADYLNSTTRPLIFIQVNTFKCGGVAIAVRGSHKISDAVTWMAFINAWASASRVGVHEVIPPSFVLPSKIPVRPSSGIFKLVPRVDPNSKLVTQRYVFDKNAISVLKLKAKAPVGDDNSGVNANQFWVSKVEVVSAIIWKALISIAREQHGHLIPSVMVQNLNLRGRTSPPMPDNTCGNFYSVATARFTADESKIDFHFLVALTRDAIRKTINMYSKSVLDSNEFFCTVTSKFDEARDEMQRPAEESHFLWCSSWCKIPFYEADFGWGKPSWISNACRIAEMVTLQDTKSGEGVEAWVTLKGEDMIKFQQDVDLLSFTS